MEKPGKKPLPTKRKFNYIYTSLVQQERDLIGIIAYSLYKQDKINHIKTIGDQHGREITDAEIDEFHRSSINPRAIEGYRQKAKENLEIFLTNFYSRKRRAFVRYSGKNLLPFTAKKFKSSIAHEVPKSSG